MRSRLYGHSGTAPWVTFQLRKVNGVGGVGESYETQETCTKRPLIMNRGNSSPTVDTAAPLTPVDPRLLNIRYTEQCVCTTRKVTTKYMLFVRATRP